jgi:hypothetical protein
MCWKYWLVVLGICLGLAPGYTIAQTLGRPRPLLSRPVYGHEVPCPCPTWGPAIPSTSIPSGEPETTDPSGQAPSTDPLATPGADSSALSGMDAFAQAPPAGTSAPGTGAPNMFGDRFGGGSGASLVVLPVAVGGEAVTGPNTPTRVNAIGQQQALVNIPNPSGGGTVGREFLAESINPLPRDRFIFDFDYFNNTPLTANGWDVYRYVVGIEKTFFNENASVELRLPFATTLNNDIVLGAENSNTEFGNMRILLKGLLFGNDTVNIASGLGIHLPTAGDTRVSTLNGIDLVQISNDTVMLSPYIGALFTPNDRLFVQSWLALDFDPSGNQVYVADPTFSGLAFAGRLNEQTLFQADAQVGYWVHKTDDPSATLRGLAPFLELHYRSPLGDQDFVAANGFLIGDLNGNRDELNLTTGLLARLGDRTTVSLAAVVPLRGNDDRSFDFQIGVRLNVFFGPTLWNPGRGTFVP